MAKKKSEVNKTKDVQKNESTGDNPSTHETNGVLADLQKFFDLRVPIPDINSDEMKNLTDPEKFAVYNNLYSETIICRNVANNHANKCINILQSLYKNYKDVQHGSGDGDVSDEEIGMLDEISHKEDESSVAPDNEVQSKKKSKTKTKPDLSDDEKCESDDGKKSTAKKSKKKTLKKKPVVSSDEDSEDTADSEDSPKKPVSKKSTKSKKNK